MGSSPVCRFLKESSRGRRRRWRWGNLERPKVPYLDLWKLGQRGRPEACEVLLEPLNDLLDALHVGSSLGNGGNDDFLNVLQISLDVLHRGQVHGETGEVDVLDKQPRVATLAGVCVLTAGTPKTRQARPAPQEQPESC